MLLCFGWYCTIVLPCSQPRKQSNDEAGRREPSLGTRESRMPLTLLRAGTMTTVYLHGIDHHRRRKRAGMG